MFLPFCPLTRVVTMMLGYTKNQLRMYSDYYLFVWQCVCRCDAQKIISLVRHPKKMDDNSRNLPIPSLWAPPKPFLQESYWPILFQMLAISLTGIFIYGGIKWVAKVNMIFVPVIFTLLIVLASYALKNPYSAIGIKFLFTPTWSE